MLARIIILAFVLTIIFSLGSGLYYLVRNKGESQKVVKALTWRIALSVFLFILLLLAFATGWIKPHGI